MLEQFLEYAGQFEGRDDYLRGRFEFSWLVTAATGYFTVRVERSEKPTAMHSDVFKNNLLFALQGGRDLLIQMLPMAERVIPETRDARRLIPRTVSMTGGSTTRSACPRPTLTQRWLSD